MTGSESGSSGPKQVADKIQRDLEFYGKPESYRRDAVTGRSPVDDDAGARARESLEKWLKK